MARARKSQVEVSLFPFLSILACVIGILVLILCSVIISQIDPQGIEEVKKDNQENIERQKRLDEIELERLNLLKELERVSKLKTQRVDFAAQMSRLRKSADKKKKEREELLKKNSKIKALSEELVIKIKHKEALQASIKEKKKLHDFLIAALNKEKERLHTKLKIESTGSGFLKNHTPTYVECTDKGISVVGDTTLEIPRGAIPKHKEWQELLKKTAEDTKGVFVFLLRPSYQAVSNYYYAKSICEKKGAKTAKIPLTSNAPLAMGAK